MAKNGIDVQEQYKQLPLSYWLSTQKKLMQKNNEFCNIFVGSIVVTDLKQISCSMIEVRLFADF